MSLTESKTARTLKASFLDGMFASGMVGFTQEYFAPFLLLLGATVKHIGMLNAFPNLFGSLIQLKSADITEKAGSRKKIINFFVLLQALMLLPMIGAASLIRVKPLIFIVFATLFTASGALANPAWGSLMSDLVKGNKRGEYFGWRNRWLGFCTIGATLIAGLILHQTERFSVFYGFTIIFSFAFAFRVVSWCYLRKMHEPPLPCRQEHYFSLVDFLSQLRKSNFAQFVLFVSLMNFSVNLASPFFSVLMLRDLGFSYILYSIITISATLTIYLMGSRWGLHADRVGNLKIIRFSSGLIGLIPLLWIFNRHPAFLICAQIFSGFIWAGFNLCTTNFIYDAVIPEKRTRCISYFNVLNGLALSAAALLGGFLLPALPALFGYKILTLFLISAGLRTIVGVFLPRRLKEVRPVEAVKSNILVFSVIGIRPLLGIERKTIRY